MQSARAHANQQQQQNMRDGRAGMTRQLAVERFRGVKQAARLDEHVVLGDEVAGHGVHATAHHGAQQQVDDGLDAARVQQRRVEGQHHRDVHQVRRPCEQ